LNIYFLAPRKIHFDPDSNAFLGIGSSARQHLKDVIIDTSALIAVIFGEPERNNIVEITTGNTLIVPGFIHH
jgi:hypothetical protein